MTTEPETLVPEAVEGTVVEPAAEGEAPPATGAKEVVEQRVQDVVQKFAHFLYSYVQQIGNRQISYPEERDSGLIVWRAFQMLYGITASGLFLPPDVQTGEVQALYARAHPLFMDYKRAAAIYFELKTGKALRSLAFPDTVDRLVELEDKYGFTDPESLLAYLEDRCEEFLPDLWRVIGSFLSYLQQQFPGFFPESGVTASSFGLRYQAEMETL